jgi:molybdopterin synthase catalytic subunit
VRVTVRYFGPAADDAGVPEERIEIAESARLGALVEALLAKHPALARRRSYLRLAVDGEYAEETAHLRDDCEVAVIPPVAGG